MRIMSIICKAHVGNDVRVSGNVQQKIRSIM
jgi:hypothetical protein